MTREREKSREKENDAARARSLSISRADIDGERARIRARAPKLVPRDGDDERLARDELARARQHFEELGEATRRSTEQVDEEILNPDILVEAVRLVLLRH